MVKSELYLDPDTHIYIDNDLNSYDSISHLFKLFRPRVDYSNIPEQIMEFARNEGSLVHLILEKEFSKNKVTKKSILELEKKTNYKGIYPTSWLWTPQFDIDKKNTQMELKICDKEFMIAGMVDCLEKNDNGNYDIKDFKYTTKLNDNYYIQVNAYKWILEKNYNIKIDNLYIYHIEKKTMKLTKVQVEEKFMDLWLEVLENYKNYREI